MDALSRDLRAVARSLRTHLGLVSWIVCIAAVGIGAAVTMFSIVDSFLLRPMPFPRADRLVWLQSEHEQSMLGVSHPDHLDWEASDALEEAVLLNADNHMVVGFEQGTESLLVTRTDGALFEVLGIGPRLGKVWGPEEDRPGGGRTVLISDRLARRHFQGRAEEALGRDLRIEGVAYTVVGVMPPGFDFPAQSDLWMPSSAWADQWPHRNIRVDSAVGLLGEGVSLRQAREILGSVSRRLEQDHPDTNTGVRLRVVPLREPWTGDSRSELFFLLGACGLLLAVTCANVGGLLLILASRQEKNNAVRLALGEPRAQLVRRRLLEGLCLGLMGGALGAGLSVWGLQAVFWMIPSRLPTWVRPEVDARVLLFALTLSMLVGLFFSAAPALRWVRINAFEVLRRLSGAVSETPTSVRLREVLVAVEIALALVLLIGAGLLLKSFAHLERTETGLDTDVLTFQVDLPVLSLQSFDQVANFYSQILNRAEALPGVESVGTATAMPFVRKGTWDLWQISLEGQAPAAQKKNPRVVGQGVTADYFSTVGIPLLGGRTFRESDLAVETRGAVVSLGFAEKLWPGSSLDRVLGKRLKLGPPESPAPWLSVVGVVGNVYFESPEREPGPALYVPLETLLSWPLYVAVQSADGNPQRLLPSLRQEIFEVSADLSLREPRLLSDHVSESLWRPRIWSTLFGGFATIAFILAAAGVFGVTSQNVRDRRREIALRRALGASDRRIVYEILGSQIGLAVLGILLGLGLAAMGSGLVRGLLYEVRALDPLILSTATLFVILLVLLASGVAFRREAAVPPADALKTEG